MTKTSGDTSLKQIDTVQNDVGDRYSALETHRQSACVSAPTMSPATATADWPDSVDTSELAPLLLEDNGREPPPPWPSTEKSPQESNCESCRMDGQVQPAAHVVEGPTLFSAAIDAAEDASAVANAPQESDRRLMASTRYDSGQGIDEFDVSTDRRLKMLLPTLSHHPSIATAAAMSVVIGLFLLSVWLVRRSASKSSMLLPDDVVNVLGRKQLAARHFAQLIHVGNKLLLVSVTPNGAKPLTEVTDPVQIDRIMGICQQGNSHSSTAAFDQMLDSLSREHDPPGIFGDDASVVPATHAAGSYLGNLGGFRNG